MTQVFTAEAAEVQRENKRKHKGTAVYLGSNLC